MSELFRSALNYIGNAAVGQNSQECDFIGQIIELGPLRLTIRRLIAEGGFAFIFLAVDQKGIEYALKRLLAADREANEAILQEINILKQLSGHPNIVCCIQAASLGKDQYNAGRDEYLILTEYCKNGPLVDVLRCLGEPFSCEQITKIFYQTCRAVYHMHSQKPPIIHCDLKIENLLFDSNWTIKLCDFGSATCETHRPDDSWSAQRRRFVEEQLASRTTPMYRAPEMLDLYQNFEINEKLDIWALGCILYYLCYLQHPFEDSAKLRIINAKYSLPSNNSRYSVFHDLIFGMLQPDPKNRPNVAEVCDRLEEIAAAINVNLNESVQFSPKTLANLQAKSSVPQSCQQSIKNDTSQGVSQSTKIFDSLKGPAGSIFKNLKDTSAKMVQNVQTNKLYGIGPFFGSTPTQESSGSSPKPELKGVGQKPPMPPPPDYGPSQYSDKTLPSQCQPNTLEPADRIPERIASYRENSPKLAAGSLFESSDADNKVVVAEADLLGLGTERILDGHYASQSLNKNKHIKTETDTNLLGTVVVTEEKNLPATRTAPVLRDKASGYNDVETDLLGGALDGYMIPIGRNFAHKRDDDAALFNYCSTSDHVASDAQVTESARRPERPPNENIINEDLLFGLGSETDVAKNASRPAPADLLFDWTPGETNSKTSDPNKRERNNNAYCDDDSQKHEFLAPFASSALHRNISAPSLVGQMQATYTSGSSSAKVVASHAGSLLEDFDHIHLSGTSSGRASPVQYGSTAPGENTGASGLSGLLNKQYPGSFSNFSQTSGAQSPSMRTGPGSQTTSIFSRPNYARSNFDDGPWTASSKVKLSENVFDDLLSAQSFPISSGQKSHQSIGAMKREVEIRELDDNAIKIRDWTEGKQRNIRALLCSLHSVLWDSNDKWEECNMSQLLTPAQVKKYYRKACLAVHPDKLAGTEHADLARLIFTELNDAWNEFAKSEHLASAP